VTISYRAALPEDYNFLFKLHKLTMQTYIEDTFGKWDDIWQEQYFRSHFDPTAILVIQLDGKDVGLLRVQERVEELFLVTLEILPQLQRQGIGTAVIGDLITLAKRQGKPIALQVLKSNILARNLYQRLGFGITGENETHYIMVYEM
jgi:ribosomal protein S18 acetylase RimI-like enzyme